MPIGQVDLPLSTEVLGSLLVYICITFVGLQCWTNVEDVGPTLYKNVLKIQFACVCWDPDFIGGVLSQHRIIVGRPICLLSISSMHQPIRYIFAGPTLWNKLPTHITSSPTLSISN